jgi:hypothetical protein
MSDPPTKQDIPTVKKLTEGDHANRTYRLLKTLQDSHFENYVIPVKGQRTAAPTHWTVQMQMAFRPDAPWGSFKPCANQDRAHRDFKKKIESIVKHLYDMALAKELQEKERSNVETIGKNMHEIWDLQMTLAATQASQEQEEKQMKVDSNLSKNILFADILNLQPDGAIDVDAINPTISPSLPKRKKGAMEDQLFSFSPESFADEKCSGGSFLKKRHLDSVEALDDMQKDISHLADKLGATITSPSSSLRRTREKQMLIELIQSQTELSQDANISAQLRATYKASIEDDVQRLAELVKENKKQQGGGVSF